jgi:hypothetical protein
LQLPAFERGARNAHAATLEVACALRQSHGAHLALYALQCGSRVEQRHSESKSAVVVSFTHDNQRLRRL